MLDGLVGSLRRVTGVSFASFEYTAKGTGEKSKITVILGASTENLYRKDLTLLERVVAWFNRIGADPTMKLAAQELLDSKRESLENGIGNNAQYTQQDTYTALNHLPGVWVHNETGELQIRGLVHHKAVLVPGTYKQVKSAPKTIIKNRIRSMLPSSRFRSYSLEGITAAKVRGNVLEFETSAA